MNKQLSQKASGNDLLANLENSLARSLKPVPPNPVFVERLGYRILNPPAITLERRTGMKAFVLLAFALFSGILLIWLLIAVGRFFNGRQRSDDRV